MKITLFLPTAGHPRSMQMVRSRMLLLCAGALALGACDGGSGGRVSFIPSPPPVPTPTPTPTPTGPTPTPAPFGLTSSQQFATFGVISSGTNGSPYHFEPVDPQAIKFSWSAEAKAYEMTLPGFAPSTLSLTFPGRNDAAFTATDANGNKLPIAVSLWPASYLELKFSYSSLGFYSSNPSEATNPYVWANFAYGVPTAVGDMPKTGTATYDAKVFGITTTGVGYDITGDAHLAFDFGAGSLAGYMRARLFSDWDGVDLALPQYDFTETVYSAGSTTFSGKFNIPNAPTDSAFQGQFTGPNAAELIAGWRAPYLDPFDKSWKSAAGVWIGKKQ